MNTVTTKSVITCPACGWAQQETMPEDACQVVYHCAGCAMALRPHAGDCCVYCSYGSVLCPPIQHERQRSPHHH